ncbi:hypothetical protein B0H13DRAFT_2324342 [Mycena leptocephala]|nr:hypothetical protein B0H13DRAFT_2324342 [Mycena leptocephala]
MPLNSNFTPIHSAVPLVVLCSLVPLSLQLHPRPTPDAHPQAAAAGSHPRHPFSRCGYSIRSSHFSRGAPLPLMLRLCAFHAHSISHPSPRTRFALYASRGPSLISTSFAPCTSHFLRTPSTPSDSCWRSFALAFVSLSQYIFHLLDITPPL